MTVIEIILSDGSLHAHLSEEREAALIAQEVRRRYPEARYWRVGRGWQDGSSARRGAVGRRMGWLGALMAGGLALVALLIAALMQGGLGANDFSLFAGSAPAREAGASAIPVAVEAGDGAEAAGDEQAATAASGSAAEDVTATVVGEQSSDTSRTLLVELHNTGGATYSDVRLHVAFYDRQGAVIPSEQPGGVTLRPGASVSVKAWAHNANGVERYELAVLE